MGVLTNKPQELTDLLIPALGFNRFFRAIHGAGKLVFVKPDARVFHHVIEEMGGGFGRGHDRRQRNRCCDRARGRRAVDRAHLWLFAGAR